MKLGKQELLEILVAEIKALENPGREDKDSYQKGYYNGFRYAIKAVLLVLDSFLSGGRLQ